MAKRRKKRVGKPKPLSKTRDKTIRARKSALRDKTPRKVKGLWAGASTRSRKRRIPPVKLPPKAKTKQVSKVTQRAGELVGQALSRGRMLTLAQKLKVGTKVRITLKGTTSAIARGEPMQRLRTFTIEGGTAKERADFLLWHAMRIVGKEFTSTRGRGYDIFEEGDRLSWAFSLVREEETPKRQPGKRRKKRRSV